MAAPENEYSQKKPYREGDCVSKNLKEARDRYVWKSVEEILSRGKGKFKVLEFSGDSCVAGAACLKKKVMENNTPLWIYPKWNINCLYIYLHHIFFIYSSLSGHLVLTIVNSVALIIGVYICFWITVLSSLVAHQNRVLLPMQERHVWSLNQEDALEKEMTTHSSILAWEIPWTEEPG